MWCVPQIDAPYVARMEDVLGLYTTLPRPGTRRRLCRRNAAATHRRSPVRVAAGPRAIPRATTTSTAATAPRMSSSRSDAHQPAALPKVTARRAAVISPSGCAISSTSTTPGTERIQVVLDNLSTHTPAAFYEAFPPAEARRVSGRLEFHYVPKHASWLNMVEIEIGVLSAQCLARRIPDLATLDAPRSTRGPAPAMPLRARVRWMFGIEQARTKLGHAYPSVAAKTPRLDQSCP